MKVCVEFDNELEVEYYKIIPIEKNINTKLTSFARKMEIIDEDGFIDTDLLDGLAVEAVLQYGSDGNLYVQKIRIDYDYYENEETCADE